MKYIYIIFLLYNIVFAQKDLDFLISEPFYNAENLIYNITIKNNQNTILNDIKIFVCLPKGLAFSKLNSMFVQYKKTDTFVCLIKEIRSQDKTKIKLKIQLTETNQNQSRENKIIEIQEKFLYRKGNCISTIENKSDFDKKFQLVYSMPTNFKYLKSNFPVDYKTFCYKPIVLALHKNQKYNLTPKKSINFFSISWRLILKPKEKKIIKFLIEEVEKKGAYPIYSFVKMNKRVSKKTYFIGVRSIPPGHLNVYDTEDPCLVNELIVYYVVFLNTNFIKSSDIILECKISPLLDIVKIDSQVDYTCHNNWIIFSPYKELADHNLKYKIFCKAKNPGIAENYFIVYNNESNEEIINLETTNIK